MDAAELHRILQYLCNERRIFHSEADFQHALAWNIQKEHPESRIRLEYKPYPKENLHLDIWLPDFLCAIELKYRTRQISCTEGDETFSLTHQGAYDHGRFDFLKDIERLERMVKIERIAKHAFALMLTNDYRYWQEDANSSSIDAEFRIHQGRQVFGKLGWLDHASQGSKKGREQGLNLMGTHIMEWDGFSQIETKNGRFLYCLVPLAE